VGYLQQFPFLEMFGAISVEEGEPSEEEQQDLQPHSLWKKPLFEVSVADPDPGSGIRCLFDPWIRDPGSGISFFRFPDPGSQTHIFESFVTIFV
jgi:hypothetical protein